MATYYIGMDVHCNNTELAVEKGRKIVDRYSVPTTMLAYLDTPWRFKRKNQLWKYCGPGLVHNSSGKDSRGRYKTGQLRLTWHANKRLKDAVMGATVCMINGKDNVFKDYYEQLIDDGLTRSNARHAVARKLLTVMWGMWKRSCRFDESLI